jgi:uncharacterized protein
VELVERFVVPAGVDRVWQLFDDVPEVVTCMPGAEVTEQVDERTYKARLAIAVGPIRPTFEVRATVERDDAVREGRIQVHAVDRRGGSQARAQIVYKLVADGDGTAVDLVQNVTLSGPLAQFGRTGVIEDVNAQLTRQFAECLAGKLGEPSPADGGAEPESSSEPIAPASPEPSSEIRILPLVGRTLLARILRALHLRR